MEPKQPPSDHQQTTKDNNQQQSAVEQVVMSIFDGTAPPVLFTIMTFTLVVLIVVITIMLFARDFSHDPMQRVHFVVFLALAVCLLASIRWYMHELVNTTPYNYEQSQEKEKDE
eukprot:TRINITY_DN9067_c0_g1_i1.p1 TRINITY_DN9067_c0_g1~~TRINITY_DN9067_c0_g1_i1.p1  ORF type:complete len:121 (-),score=19.54 TRINITY_DN9067_c0_g1_i1:20-361(-)